MICPICGEEAYKEFEGNYPHGCPCGWSEFPIFNQIRGRNFDAHGIFDQWGGYTPTDGHFECAMLPPMKEKHENN
jgi:hypothetical protein